MSWAETLKINSDISTPLDVLFKNSFRLVSSDNVLSIFGSVKAPTSSAEETVFEKTLNYGGVIKITASVDNGVRYRIYVNGEQVIYATPSADTDVEHLIEVSKGDVVKMTCGGYAPSSSFVSNTCIRGMVAIVGDIFQ